MSDHVPPHDAIRQLRAVHGGALALGGGDRQALGRNGMLTTFRRDPSRGFELPRIRSFCRAHGHQGRRVTARRPIRLLREPHRGGRRARNEAPRSGGRLMGVNAIGRRPTESSRIRSVLPGSHGGDRWPSLAHNRSELASRHERPGDGEGADARRRSRVSRSRGRRRAGRQGAGARERHRGAQRSRLVRMRRVGAHQRPRHPLLLPRRRRGHRACGERPRHDPDPKVGSPYASSSSPPCWIRSRSSVG